jgi:CheY-like chemotaxis protein/anti-sigma regulatory factor (Ser/Thr protein kinase)
MCAKAAARKKVSEIPASKILIADDDRTTRLFLGEILRNSGYSVVDAPDGKTALKKLKTGKFDLVILDVWMPNMNGIEVLAALRQESAPPKVVIMTTDGTPETVLKAIREQAYRYMKKPIDPDALIDTVRQAIAAKPETFQIEVISARPTWVELLLPCDLGVAERVERFLLDLKTDLPEETRRSIGTAFHELLSNAVEWGGKLDPNRKVRISCVRTARMVMYRIADPGPGFRFENLKHAAVSNPEEDPAAHFREREEMGLRPGGLGLLMTRQLVDELVYNEAQNEVLFVKYLDKKEEEPT